MSTAQVEITFLGGASGIGASCALVQVANTTILVDCGVRFRADALPDLSLLSGRRLDAILVTHAHSDHTGGLPVICEAFPGVPVYATPPTIDLVGILFRDALKLMRMAGERDGDLPLYNENQVERVTESLVPVHHGSSVEVGEIMASYLPASHILGASMVHLATPAGSVLFTGDFSVDAQRTVPALTRPSVHVDLVVAESTYGNRLHEDRRAAEARLGERVRDTLRGGGRLLIPAFAIGRAQEVLLILKNAVRKRRLPAVPVFVDGMVRSACEIYARHERYVTRSLAHDIHKARHPFYTDGIQPVRDAKERDQVLGAGPCVIVASSGMLSGGASVHYARAIASDPQSAILITGYQDEESPGRALLGLAEQTAGPRELKLDGHAVEFSCSVATYGLSAHADRMQMTALLDALRPRTVVLVHGDRAAKEEMSRSLSCRDVVLAEDGGRAIRGYPTRRAAVHHPVEVEIDLETARRLLGPATDSPLRSEAVAAAWFGRPVGRAERERLVDRLESLGVARRDDRRRSHVWVLTARESGLFPGEVDLEEQLKQENPKGRLLELCMRAQLDAPVLEELGTEGADFLVRSTLRYEDGTLSSGIQRAPSKKTAEQLAARALLAELQRCQAGLDIAIVLADSDARTMELKRDNPKGRLIEWCVKRRLPAPSFETRPVIGGTVARAGCARGNGTTFWTRWYQATSSKTAVHAAAAAALEELAGAGQVRDAVPADPVTAPVAETSSEPSGKDARMLLNEMRQVGVIDDFGYELIERRGPSHQPVFVMAAWAQMPGGRRVQTEEVSAAARKGAERQAAQLLVEALASA